MAKRVTFKPPKPKSGGGNTSFNFGANTMSKAQKKSYWKSVGGGS